ncbi:hypothetical protein PCAR4_60105 [Paraburkholderia caribensis]|nr:hypothetical protein PCAR4_60105 [Paraburkholderia caribensis]
MSASKLHEKRIHKRQLHGLHNDKPQLKFPGASADINAVNKKIVKPKTLHDQHRQRQRSFPVFGQSCVVHLVASRDETGTKRERTVDRIAGVPVLFNFHFEYVDSSDAVMHGERKRP